MLETLQNQFCTYKIAVGPFKMKTKHTLEAIFLLFTPSGAFANEFRQGKEWPDFGASEDCI